MHDINLNLYYVTTFDVRCTTTDDSLLDALASFVRRWLTDKWQRKGIRLPEDDSWLALKDGTRLSSLDSARTVRLESAVFQTGTDSCQWACRIQESLTPTGVARRTWNTEFGLEQHGPARGTLTVAVSYGDMPGFVGPTETDPQPRVPGIVSHLAQDGRLICSTSGRPLPLAPTELGSTDFPAFWDFVQDPDRSTPVVFISPVFAQGEAPRRLVDPQLVSSMLGPAAFVFSTTSHGFMNGMQYALEGTSLACWGGALRVYAAHPVFESADDYRRHHFFVARHIQETGSSRVAQHLRRALAQDANTYQAMIRVETIREARRALGIRLRARQMVRDSEEHALQWVSDMEDERALMEHESVLLREENDKLRSANHALRGTVAQLRGATGHTTPALSPSIQLEGWPLSPTQVGQLFVACYPTRIDLTERGWRSLARANTDPALLWNALHDLATIAWELHAGGTSTNVQAEFNSRSTFAYSHSIGSMTRRSTQLERAYHDSYQGRDVTCTAHIGRGNVDGDPGSVRVYFCFDATSGKIVISHCGKHLPTFSGR